MRLGLTGNIGAGKSTAARLLKEEIGGAIIDADAIGHHLLETNTAIQQEIRATFGPTIVDEAHRIDRRKLGQLVFEEQSNVDALNRIFYPHMMMEIKIQIARAEKVFHHVILDAALIVEWNIQKDFDKLIVVAAPREVRLQRLMEYRRLLEEDAEARIDRQADEALKVEIADYVIQNAGSLDELTTSVKTVAQKFTPLKKPIRKLRAAICQLRVTENKSKNLDQAFRAVEQAKAKGAKLVVLPEMFTCPFRTELFPEYAESISSGPATKMLRQAAADCGIYLVGGSLPERAGKKVYNTSLIYDPHGKRVGVYRKTHLFDAKVGSLNVRESSTINPGKSLTTFATPFGRIGVAICYDLRFPELFRSLVKRGVVAVALPAAFSITTGRDHWWTLLRTRAIDNQIFMLAASPARNPKSRFGPFGFSSVIGPWGRAPRRHTDWRRDHPRHFGRHIQR